MGGGEVPSIETVRFESCVDHIQRFNDSTIQRFNDSMIQLTKLLNLLTHLVSKTLRVAEVVSRHPSNSPSLDGPLMNKVGYTYLCFLVL